MMKKNQPIVIGLLLFGLAGGAYAGSVEETETPSADSAKAAPAQPIMPGYVAPYQAPMPHWSIPQPPTAPAFTGVGLTEAQRQVVEAQRDALAKQYQQLEQQRSAMLEAQREAAAAATKPYVPTDASAFATPTPWAHAPYARFFPHSIPSMPSQPAHPVGPVGYAGAPMFETHQQVLEQINQQAAAQQQHVLDTLQQAQERHMSAVTHPFAFRGPYSPY